MTPRQTLALKIKDLLTEKQFQNLWNYETSRARRREINTLDHKRNKNK